MTKPSITAVVIVKNEAQMIKACLDCLQWCTDILVIDNGSVDSTAEVAEKMGARVISFKHNSFARIRSEALKVVTSDWLLYVDADERVTPDLAKEIQVHLETGEHSALEMVRENYLFGQRFDHGGWQEDAVTRAFLRSSLSGWQGEVHETPLYSGSKKRLSFPLVHFTHRNIESGLKKTVSWTQIEADLLFKAGEPPVSFIKIIKKGASEFVRRAWLKQGYRDGAAGLIESLIQAINRVFVYIEVWELQQKPPLEKKYEKLEKQIKEKWMST